MPYYTAAMVRYMRQQGLLSSKLKQTNRSKRFRKQTKIHLSCNEKLNRKKTIKLNETLCEEDFDINTGSYIRTQPIFARSGIQISNKILTFDEKKLRYMKCLLAKQVFMIQNQTDPTPIIHPSFNEYIIHYDQPSIDLPSYQNELIYFVTHKEFSTKILVARIYDKNTGIRDNPLYLKIIKHLSKKHPNIVQVWDIFQNDEQVITVIEDYSHAFPMDRYLAEFGPQTELVVHFWCRQIYSALDFLGDMGICHNNLMPKYLMIKESKKTIRLTGFYKSIIYWDASKENIIFNNCIPLPDNGKMLEKPTFRPPEIYSNTNESYDPLMADIWSLGAILFNALSCTYPYNYKIFNPLIEDEIKNNIKNKLNVSEDCIGFLETLLTTKVKKRFSFDQFLKHNWFAQKIVEPMPTLFKINNEVQEIG